MAEEHNRRPTDTGWRKYKDIYPWLAGALAIVAMFVTMQNKVDAGEESRKDLAKRVERVEKAIPQINTSIAVIQSDQQRQKEDTKEIKDDVKMILREIRK